MLSNGSFANGLSGWSSCGAQSGVAGDAASLGAGGCIYQEFAVIPQITYTASCEANVPSGYSSMTLAISDSGFDQLAEELIEEPNGVNGGITATATAPDTSAIGVITLFADENIRWGSGQMELVQILCKTE